MTATDIMTDQFGLWAKDWPFGLHGKIQAAINAAVKVETKRCAKVARKTGDILCRDADSMQNQVAQAIAEAIEGRVRRKPLARPRKNRDRT